MKNTNHTTKNAVKSNRKSQETDAVKDLNSNRDSVVDAAVVKAMTDEGVKNCVLIASIVMNLFIITAFFLAVSDAPSAQALGSMIANL